MARTPRGFSTAELIVAMTLIGILTMLAAARFAAFRDGAAVHSASAETIHAFAIAREMAVTQRTALTVRLDTVRGSVEVRSHSALVLRRDLLATYQVGLATNRDSMVYDPRGLGFGVANLTLVLRRGQAVDTVIVSRLGRVR